MNSAVDVFRITSAVQAVLSLAITVALGAVTLRMQRQQTAIAHQQAATNRLQYRLSLFDRRMKVFDATTRLFGEITRDGKVDLAQLFTFSRDTRQRDLLFGDEIREYLDEIYKKGVDLHVLGERSERQPELIQPESELFIWFANQFPVATQKFLKYLDFREP